MTKQETAERDRFINALMAIALGDEKPVEVAMRALGWKELVFPGQ